MSARAVSLLPGPHIGELDSARESARAKPLQRQRIHTSPDPDLEGLSPSEVLDRKLRAKQLFHRLVSKFQSLRGGKLSNYDLAELLLGTREKEGTIRAWRRLSDLDRAPRDEDNAKLEGLIKAALDERSGAFR